MQNKENIESINNAWHHLKQTNDTVNPNENIDPLIISKIQSLNDFIDRQQQEINALKTAFARPISVIDGKRNDMNRHDIEYKSLFCNYLRKGSDHGLSSLETKSVSLSGNNNDFGFSITSRMSEQISNMLQTSSIMRVLAKVDEISNDALELIDDRDEIDSGWSADADSIINNGNALNPSRKIILAHELYAQPKVTQRLLDDPRVDVEDWVASKLVDAFAMKENSAFIYGDGDGKPRGILSYQNGSGWGSVEQFSIEKNGKISIDAIFKLFFALKERYAVNAKFLMSRSALQAVRLLKDDSGSYIWNPGMNSEASNTILGCEVFESPDMPEVSNGNAVIAFADFKRAYQIVEKPGIKLIRDPYTGKPFVKYYALKRVGGEIVNFDAIKLLSC